MDERSFSARNELPRSKFELQFFGRKFCLVLASDSLCFLMMVMVLLLFAIALLPFLFVLFLYLRYLVHKKQYPTDPRSEFFFGLSEVDDAERKAKRAIENNKARVAALAYRSSPSPNFSKISI